MPGEETGILGRVLSHLTVMTSVAGTGSDLAQKDGVVGVKTEVGRPWWV